MTIPARPMPAVADFMTGTVYTVRPETDVTQAVGVLTQRSCSGAPVVDADGRVVGVLTHEGCMRALSGAAYTGEHAGKVDDHMSREFAVVEPTADLFRVVSMFSNEAGRRILVADHGKLVGIVTRTDALKALDKLRKLREGAAGDGVNIESVAVGWSALTD
jgi:predicted transcriptional regulator